MQRVLATGAERGDRKDPPIVWDGPVGPEFFGEAVYEFLVECKSDFTKDSPLRGYVQMMAEGTDGGRRFFRCPRAWVIAITLRFHKLFVMFSKINTGLFVLVFRGSGRLQIC